MNKKRCEVPVRKAESEVRHRTDKRHFIFHYSRSWPVMIFTNNSEACKHKVRKSIRRSKIAVRSEHRIDPSLDLILGCSLRTSPLESKISISRERERSGNKSEKEDEERERSGSQSSSLIFLSARAGPEPHSPIATTFRQA